MKTLRVYQLAKQLNISTEELISTANKLKISINSHLNTLNTDDVSVISEYINKIKKSKKPIILDWDTTELNSQFQEHVQISFQQLENLDDLVKLMKKVNKKVYGKYSPQYGENPYVQKKYLTYYAYHSSNKYTIFDIAKKSGGTREIFAPNKGLKYILKTLNIIFQAIHKPQLAAHGFLPNRSVVTNAKLHVNKNYVFNIDLENFFPNIHQARVWKRLQYPPFNLSGERIELANLIASLVCFQYGRNSKEKNFLPQGAPTSPILSNIICHRLDKKLLNLAKQYNLKYTRYADDMTFSSDHNVYQKDSAFLKKLCTIIKQENFSINEKKTRLQKKGYKQEVTGIIVNEKINVSRRYIKNIRALIHMVDKYGDKKSHNIYAKKNEGKNLELVINGKLQYLKMVKGKDDNTYQTLYKKYLDAYELKEVEVVDKKQPEETKVITKKSKNIECEHNSKKLVKILSKFSDKDSPFKWSVHSEGYEDQELYNSDYNKFILSLEKEFNEIDQQLKKLSHRLHGKVKAFLFSKKLGKIKKGTKYKNTWGDNQIEFGWSSPELKEWCLKDTKNIPFDFTLPENNQSIIGEKTISKFIDVTTAFKNEIEVRSDNDALFNLIEDINEKVLKFEFNIEYSEDNICGKDFYTDFHWLSKGIKKIFEEIKKREDYKTIKIYFDKNDSEFLELYITQVDSVSKKDSRTLLQEVNDGDFADIKQYLCSLCDWSVEAKHSNDNFRVNYLKSDNIDDIEVLDHEVEGFTHILRFYK